jgi:hypothetical protein
MDDRGLLKLIDARPDDVKVVLMQPKELKDISLGSSPTGALEVYTLALSITDQQGSVHHRQTNVSVDGPLKTGRTTVRKSAEQSSR